MSPQTAQEEFFKTPSDPSKVKFEIVRKYFWSWAKIIAPRARSNIAYIDLFSGKGIYDDGSKATPILILEGALRDNLIKSKLITIFNDVTPEHTATLQAAINSIPNIDQLKNKPVILNEKIGDDFGEVFKKMSIVPTLLFVDPWGYMGITLDLLEAILKDWGCDCTFFFNYNRINMCISNPILNPKINMIFGNDRATKIKKEVKYMKPKAREDHIIANLKEALKEIGGEYFLTFKFKDTKHGTKTTHFLVFVSKNPLAYTIMKSIMAKESSYHIQNVPSYVYTPYPPDYSYDLFPPEPLKDLRTHILKEYQGKSLTFNELFETDHLDKPFIEKNYKQVFLKLERENKIITNPPQDRRRKDTFGKNVLITLPKLSNTKK